MTNISRKEYLRNYQREWLKARRDKWIEENGPCQKCGSTTNLEIDHIDRTQKKINVSQIWSRKEEVREAELAKCQVLCHDCHLDKTISELSKPSAHGKRNTYSKYGCRCDPCKEAKREDNANRYK